MKHILGIALPFSIAATLLAQLPPDVGVWVGVAVGALRAMVSLLQTTYD